MTRFHSLLLWFTLLAVVFCEEVKPLDSVLKPPEPTKNAEGGGETIQLSYDEAKKKGIIKWKDWIDTEDYRYYVKAMRNYFKPLELGHQFFGQLATNITYLSTDKYDYYIRNAHAGFIGWDTTWVIIMGSGHRNETHWVGSQVEKAIDMVRSKECC